MKLKKCLHILAILFSSIISMFSYGHAKLDVSKKVKKGSDSELSKNENDATTRSSDASQEPHRPPLKLDPALMASAQHSTPLPPHSSQRSWSG